MNIFVTDPDPARCAYALDDRRLVKMVLETAQLLSTAIFCCGSSHPVLYKPTHVNHPCSVWARTSRDNFMWLHDHGVHLSLAYTFRFGKVHKSTAIIQMAEEYVSSLPPGDLTPFKNCTDFKDIDNVYEAYRYALRTKWRVDADSGRPPKWTNSTPPEWRFG